LANDLEQYKFPKIDTLVELWKRYFPEDLQVQYYVTGVIIELPEVSIDARVQRLEKLPNYFTNSNANLSFTNGLRPLTQKSPSLNCLMVKRTIQITLKVLARFPWCNDQLDHWSTDLVRISVERSLSATVQDMKKSSHG
jgi:hypothetical protein